MTKESSDIIALKLMIQQTANVERLKAQNAELLEALKIFAMVGGENLDDKADYIMTAKEIRCARAVIARPTFCLGDCGHPSHPIPCPYDHEGKED